jgi:hypothetical protein
LVARIERLLCDAADDLPECGHLAYLTGSLAVLSGDLSTAQAEVTALLTAPRSRCCGLDNVSKAPSLERAQERTGLGEGDAHAGES